MAVEEENKESKQSETPKPGTKEYSRWYYQNFTKKGTLKGRKKATPKKKTSTPKKAKSKKATKPKMSQEQKEQLKAEKDQIRADTKAQRAALSLLLKNKIANIRAMIKSIKTSTKKDVKDTDSNKAGLAEKEKLRTYIKEIQAKGKEIREKITQDNLDRLLAADNAMRAKAGMPPKTKAKAPTPTTTKLDEEYANMLT